MSGQLCKTGNITISIINIIIFRPILFQIKLQNYSTFIKSNLKLLQLERGLTKMLTIIIVTVGAAD